MAYMTSTRDPFVDTSAEMYGFSENTQKAAAYHWFLTRLSYSTHDAGDKVMHLCKQRLVKQAFSPKGLKIWLRSVFCQMHFFAMSWALTLRLMLQVRTRNGVRRRTCQIIACVTIPRVY
jgi:hypothetical protein